MAAADVEMRVETDVAAASPIQPDSPGPIPIIAPPHASAPPSTSETHVLQARKKAKAPSSARGTAASPAELAPAGANATSPATSTSPAPPAAASKPSSRANGHRPRTPSPSPPPLPARPPLQTIRLDIPLGGPEDYEIDIRKLSKDTGQRPPTPPRVLSDVGRDESSESEPEERNAALKPKKKRKRKNAAQEYYDVSDPFIDDSELAIDERTFFAQTKQQGFYVSSGQVALLTDKPAPKKPKSKAVKRLNILPPAASVTAALSSVTLPSGPLSTTASKVNTTTKPANKLPIAKLPIEPTSVSAGPSKLTKSESVDNNVPGTREAPIPLDSDDTPQAAPSSPSASVGMKRKASETMDESMPPSSSVASIAGESESKKRKKAAIQIRPFHPDLEAAIVELKDAIAKEDWSQKGKFPANLKPLLNQVALKAIVLGEYDDNFFNLMPKIFPYNRFTMLKLIKRTVWRDHMNLLVERQNALIEDLRVLAADGFQKAQEEWERSVVMWERRQTVRPDGQDGQAPAGAQPQSNEGTPVPSSTQPTPLMGSTALPPSKSLDDSADMDVDDPHGGTNANGKGPATAKDAHPPPKRYKLTDTMKGIIWQLVCLSNECCRIENEKNQLENDPHLVSDQGVRKTLYQKIVAAFPEGWLSSGQISREVSVMKKKYEKEVMENEAET